MIQTIKVFSSHGHLIVNAVTGAVRTCVADGPADYLPAIERFDVARYRERFRVSEIPEEVDILRLAYWDNKDLYELPAENYEPDFEKVSKERLDELYQYLLANIDSIPGCNVYENMDGLLENGKITELERITWGVDFRSKEEKLSTKAVLQKIIDEMY